MARPIEEWLNHPDNQWMFDRITEEMTTKICLGHFNYPGTKQLNPDAAEAWRNQQKSSASRSN